VWRTVAANMSQASGLLMQSDLHSIAEEEEEKKVRCLKFRQQDMWALKPVWSPKCVVVMYYIIAVIFIPVGVSVLIKSLTMSQTDRFRYDNVGDCDVGEVGRKPPLQCTIQVTLEKDTGAPTFMYYGLVNYFQNARNYIKSLSAEQLRGKASPNTADCEKAGEGIDYSSTSKVVPCGLTAFSRFNDTFRLCRDPRCNDEVKLRKEGIAWDVDREKRFKAGEVGSVDGYTKESNKIVTDEDFMVWMRLATYNNFHKLYRIIDEPLSKGTYYVIIEAAYPVEQFSGEKFIFFSETSWFGGRSRFLGVAYLVIGGISLVAATLFCIRAGTAPSAQLPPETTIPAEGYSAQQDSSGNFVQEAYMNERGSDNADGADALVTPKSRPA
jgi:LEM3 (ligand-effect modulator 3) family / CDC50 family